MKNTDKIIGIISTIAVIAFSLAGFGISLTGCPEPVYTTRDATLTGITLNIYSVKKNYNQGDTIDLSGLVVTAHYKNKQSKLLRTTPSTLQTAMKPQLTFTMNRYIVRQKRTPLVRQWNTGT